ncbi:MAG: PqqD family protein [Gammaproteobacteria bacterium]|nr:PqqD family protein [Gammaproteobacteria bacterium]
MTNSKDLDSSSDSGLFPPLDVLNRLAVSESGFVFDPSSGHNFTVNETGLVLLRLLMKEQRLDQILEMLRNEFDADPRDIERDVIEFVSALRENVGA